MKKIISLMLAVLLVFGALPLSLGAAAESTAPELRTDSGKPAAAESGEPERHVNTEPVTIDDDPEGGYEGDYVVIYNPSEDATSSMSTGNMSGLIDTSVSANMMPGENDDVPDRNSYIIDVDQLLAEEAERLGYTGTMKEGEPVRALSFNVGDTRTFNILLSYSPTGSSSIKFKVLAKGEHCYIWTPVSSSSNTWPLDTINATYGDLAAAEFDGKFDLMQSSFGQHSNGTNGDGRVHLLFYNVEDGWNWQTGGGYIGGFFYSADYNNNGLPIVNIDTYPSVHYVKTDGTTVIDDITASYGTMMHEYQHMIHYSKLGNSAASWLNECMSAAAEEICYPGSSIFDRIMSYTNCPWTYQAIMNPSREYATTNPTLHYGYSMYAWDQDISDILALYGQVSLFSQYLYTQSPLGNAVFKAILTELAKGKTFQQACPAVLGMSASEFVRDFRIALTANTSQDILDGKYGWVLQSGYDPSEYYDVENPYNILGPIIYQSNSCSIKGGGAITVKPLGGVYNPPSDANSGLQYFGIKLPPPTSLIWDFETDPSTQGFTFIDMDGDGRNWEWKYPTSNDGGFKHHEGLGCIVSASYDNNIGPLNPDNWMITPEFTGSYLTFWARAQEPEWADEYIGVFVSTDSGSTWSDELDGYTLTGYDTQYEIDLSAYSDTPIKVAFRHYKSTDQFYANVDYIEVSLESEPEVTPQPTLTPEPMLTEAPITPGEGIYIEKSVSLDGEDGLYTLTVSVCTTNTLYDASTVVWDYLSSSVSLADNTSWQLYFDPCTGLDDDGVPQFSSQFKMYDRKDVVCSIGSDENGQYFYFTGIDYSDFVCSETGGQRIVFSFHGLAANDDAIGTFSPSKDDISGVYWNNALIASAEPVSVNIRSISAVYDFSTPLQLTASDIRQFISLHSAYDKTAYEPEPFIGFSVSTNGNKLDCSISAVSQDVYTAKSLLWLNDNSFEWSSITVLPATVVMYEENYASFNDGGSSWETESSASVTAPKSGDSVYGYDAAYAENTGDSNFSSMKVTVDSALYASVSAGTASWPSAQFVFTGTGIDFITRCAEDSGLFSIDLVPSHKSFAYNGSNSSHVVIDTWYSGDIGTVLYQLPIFQRKDLDYDTYKMRIRALYFPENDHQQLISNEDIRAIPGLENVEYEYIRLSGESKRDPMRASGTFNAYIDGFRVYNPLGTNIDQPVYSEANELNPVFKNIRAMLRSQPTSTQDSVLNLKFDGETRTVTPADYDSISPAYEVYIRDNMGVAFSIEGNYARAHISLKSPTGDGMLLKVNGEYLRDADGEPIVIRHSSELYYDITEYIDTNSNVELLCEAADRDGETDPVLSIVTLKLIPNGDQSSPTVVADPDLVEFSQALHFGVLGDADNDGEVTVTDALTIMRFVLGSGELGVYGTYCADVNGDNCIDLTDTLGIIHIVLCNG